MFIKTRIVLASAACLLALMACTSKPTGQSKQTEQSAAPSKGAVAATVNGIPISERMLDLMLRQRTELGHAVNPEIRKTYIDRMAMQVLVSQAAIKEGLDKTPDVVDRMALMRQSILIDAFVKKYFKTHPVSEEQLDAAYAKMKAGATGKEYKARHILVPTEAEAKAIIAKLNKNPKAFAELAQKDSKDTASKGRGGELGWFDPRSVVPEFGAAVAKLAKGKFTEKPVKTQFGYHVILLEDSRPVSVPPLEQVKPALTRQLQDQSLKKLFDEMKAKAKIEIVQASAQAPVATPTQAAKPAEAVKK
jgi:peptidyl-prolyl cis-trans isomerase C